MQDSSIGSAAQRSHFQASSLSSQNQFASRTQARNELTPEEEKQVEELKKRDREVRRHEQAHKAAAGKNATGGPSYDYQTGPDGKRYAVGGEVQIDTSSVKGDPEATIRKARNIKSAALAPQDPSSQDRQVAAEASRIDQEARQEVAKQKTEESKPYNQHGERAGQKPEPAAVDMFV